MKKLWWLVALAPILSHAAGLGPYGVFGGPISSANLESSYPATAAMNGTFAFTTDMGLMEVVGGAWEVFSGGGSGSPGGSNTQVQYNSSGSFAGSANFTWNGTQITVGASGTLGGVILGNASTGTITIQPVTGALGTVTASLPANTGTIAELNLAQSWTAAQTFTNSDIKLLGSSTGATTITSANASATVYTATLPAATDTIAEIAATQTLTNKSIAASEVNSGTLAAAQMPALTGDVTSSAGAVATTIAAGAVTLAKQANFAASSLMGNPTGSAAAPSAITLGAGLSFSGSTLVASGGAATSITPGTTTITGATSPCLIDNTTSTTMGCATTSSATLADLQAVTTFTIAPTGCTPSAHAGGPFGGTITLASGPCTSIVVTMNGATGFTAPVGYHCDVNDLTLQTAGTWFGEWGESATSTTTATIPIPSAAGATDVISFNCNWY